MPRRGGREVTDIPSTIERSDKHAQHIWKKTHDSAVETYGEGERAHRAAFASLKHSYKKQGDRWVKKDQKGPSDPQAARGPTTSRKSYGEKPARTAGGKVKDLSEWRKEDLYQRAQQLGIRGRSRMDKKELMRAIERAVKS